MLEGPKLIEEAVKHGGIVTTLIYAEGWQGTLFSQLDCRQITLPESLFASISDTNTPQGVMAICKRPDTTPPAVLEGTRYLVLDGVQDPGNVGTIWRTADAFGADGLILLEGCAQPFSAKTVRATMGACFRLPVYEVPRDNLIPLLGELPLYATALTQESMTVGKADLTCGALVIGSEGQGVSPQVLALCHHTLKIPMRVHCESLNAAIAAAIVLWEGWR